MPYRLILLLLTVLLASCTLFHKQEEVVATVNGEKLTLSELKANFTDAQFKALTNEQRKSISSSGSISPFWLRKPTNRI